MSTVSVSKPVGIEYDKDPLAFSELCWPGIMFYDKQEQILQSIVENNETVVPAGNMLGKDFVAGFISLWYFLTHHPVRIITTSVKDDHLRVLWGEINRFIETSVVPLKEDDGGPLVVRHHDIRKIVNGELCKYSYLHGCVSLKGEGMAGHHARYTLLVMDEASGIDNIVYTQGDTWAKKKFIFGNPNPCSNFFYQGIKEGNIEGDDGSYLRKVIRIRAEDSPNVRVGLELEKKGKKGIDHEIVPGVLSYSEYKRRRALWDKIRQCVGLDAEFYEGAEILLFPAEWLNKAESVADRLERNRSGRKVIGVDTAEGGDKSSWTVVDEYGIVEMISMKTPDTSIIPGHTIALMNRHKVFPEDTLFDLGGGGKEHVDRLRRQGYDVRGIRFGEAASTVDISSERTKRYGFERLEDRENKYVYKNRRAEMYGELRMLLDPVSEYGPFGIPVEYTELRRQLSPIPLLYDEEGRLELPPKIIRSERSTKVSLVDLIGHSPDEADSLVLAVHGLLHPADEHQIEVGGLW